MNKKSTGKKIIVTGSYNASIFAMGKVIPGIGETVVSDSYFISAGGKGSNQAIAAKFQGADVRFIGKLGADSYANDAIKLYQSLDMYNDSIYRDEGANTGLAVIFIDEAGNNSIMVCPGANLNLTVDEIVKPVLAEKEVYIAGFQLENDVNVVCNAIRKLHEAGIRTLLDPAPAVPLPDWVYPCLTILKPNEHEAGLLSSIKINSPEDAFRAGEWFLNKGVETAIITMGENGTVICGKNIRQYIETPKVDAIDTTGAGDIFSGSLMAALAEGKELVEAVKYANIAASISVTQKGVYEATPKKEDVETYIKKHSL
jgi:ribokinase